MTNKITIAIILALAVTGIAVLGANAQTTTANPPQEILPAPSKQLDIACIKTAVEKRENAIQSAWDKFSVSIKSALEMRKGELIAAWDITDKVQRRNAINAAWMKFKNSRISARKTLNEERRAIWKQFKTDRRLCGSGPTGENQGTDIAL